MEKEIFARIKEAKEITICESLDFIHYLDKSFDLVDLVFSLFLIKSG